ncbi:D-TA family PLP-dependent enzyme [Yeosuana sp. MJ-SS3]|uniref:D-TA family PLP-dependent enzyme n=1 Tax=Gilvirhabdus luticola TaxID=3079858 RepID=A0ABU3U9H7_9FLAO|nr:D-TA family PLP-dependent enzyme [Yeosuana sp. MJ-SS3]MDU8887058.1 D-TA family PLP-dependent enzyme [Yeosuana sp. MJ-SS3]
MNNWYEIDRIQDIDSPSLVLYKNHFEHNLHKMLEMVNNQPEILMPHIKTNKMPKVLNHFIALGILNFKASTISEAEIAAKAGAVSVLLAHQLVGPKIDRFCNLINHFPETQFLTIVDNKLSVRLLNEAAQKHHVEIGIFIDVNNGMNRSGIEPNNNVYELVDNIKSHNNLYFKGLHVYDGHFRDPNFQERKNRIEDSFSEIITIQNSLKKSYPNIQLICGGTPSFTSHLLEPNRICSPGTCVFWDFGYNEKLAEQQFKFAVLVITRVVSMPKKGIVTIDLGHKAVASENPIDKRIRFLNLSKYTLLSQSEEHGVLSVEHDSKIEIGDVLYGVPYHICPTINLYDDITVISDSKNIDVWEISARKRKLTI